MNDDESDSIDLQIDELVLNGFAAAEGHAIGDAFERELARLLAEQGIPGTITQQMEISAIEADANALERGSDADTIAGGSAKALYGGLHR